MKGSILLTVHIFNFVARLQRKTARPKRCLELLRIFLRKS
ncbi:hypothetical protein CLOSTMETH_02693 [[Clostridium] methylpentosum DSM 5476]|uniref:Uncharacterized protein n=1 Tax=[Clostridium] methylpentosum DSM 5476 TaxID=537013 RepID=C0EFQ1_9FIRM|nr:hypothetical protein CLOSTMETH_02693 [[Clostridium] methylpentosum DSM 5476]